MFLYYVLVLTDETFVWKQSEQNTNLRIVFDECFLLKNKNKNHIVVSKLNRVFPKLIQKLWSGWQHFL